MTLTTHAIVGAAVASFFPQDPALGFTLAFASHFALDAIPHWDYPIESASIHPSHGAKMKYDKALLHDFFRIGTDALLGLILGLAIFATTGNFWIVMLGIIGGMLPDALQFVHIRLKREPLTSLQRFHHFIHKGSEYFNMENHSVVGIISQSIFLIAFVFLVKFFV
ncbi:MAG TPA: hypothetical protein VMR73_00355 [Candidatus Paceibacterota bacterium]|nr:hypothetical protein [Candidatus Paceibacterota bacterium]